jgi:hypothetical protein
MKTAGKPNCQHYLFLNAQSQSSKTEHTIDFVKRTGDVLLLKLTDSDIVVQ